jgi:hypothetical protein
MHLLNRRHQLLTLFRQLMFLTVDIRISTALQRVGMRDLLGHQTQLIMQRLRQSGEELALPTIALMTGYSNLVEEVMEFIDNGGYLFLEIARVHGYHFSRRYSMCCSLSAAS